MCASTRINLGENSITLKMNVLADKLATRATEEFDSSDLEWNFEIGPILEIDGALPPTRRE